MARVKDPHININTLIYVGFYAPGELGEFYSIRICSTTPHSAQLTWGDLNTWEKMQFRK